MKSHRSVRVRMGCLVAASAAMLALAGCLDGGTLEATTSVANSVTDVAVATANASKTATFTALYFDKKDVHDPELYLENKGYTDIASNGDGSYTATVPSEDYEALVKDAYALTKSLIDAIPGDDTYPNCTAVDYDEQLATVTVSFSTDVLAADESLVAYIPGEAAIMYQQIAGLPVGCDVILVGSDGSELSNTMFPVKAASAEGTSSEASA